MSRTKYLSVGIFCISIWSLSILAQTQESKTADSNFSLNVDVELVQLPVSVLDKGGRVVEGLAKDDFHVFEKGVQRLDHFKFHFIRQSPNVVM